jgi:hypothetical protein
MMNKVLEKRYWVIINQAGYPVSLAWQYRVKTELDAVWESISPSGAALLSSGTKQYLQQCHGLADEVFQDMDDPA